MFENFTTPEQIFSFKLGSLLQAEKDVLKLLTAQSEVTQHVELKTLLDRHYAETEQQIKNIEEAFRLLGEEPDTNASPVSKGLAKESAASIKKTDGAIVDAVIIAGTLEGEYLEQAQYEVLVVNAKARGAEDVAALLQQNLDQEVAMGRAIKALGEQLAFSGYAPDTTAVSRNGVPAVDLTATQEKVHSGGDPNATPYSADAGSRRIS